MQGEQDAVQNAASFEIMDDSTPSNDVAPSAEQQANDIGSTEDENLIPAVAQLFTTNISQDETASLVAESPSGTEDFVALPPPSEVETVQVVTEELQVSEEVEVKPKLIEEQQQQQHKDDPVELHSEEAEEEAVVEQSAVEKDERAEYETTDGTKQVDAIVDNEPQQDETAAVIESPRQAAGQVEDAHAATITEIGEVNGAEQAEEEDTTLRFESQEEEATTLVDFEIHHQDQVVEFTTQETPTEPIPELPQDDDDDAPRAPQHYLSARRRNSSMSQQQQQQRVDNYSVREDAIFAVLDDPELLDIDHLLSLQDEVLLESVVSVGLGVSNLSTLLAKLTEMCRDPAQPSYAKISPLLRGLRLGVSTKSRGPSRVFCHSGAGSGIEMTGLTAFTKCFPHVWGVACWLWVAAEAQPFTLCSFMTKEDFGVSVTVLPAEERSAFLFESKDDKKRDGIQFATSALRLRQWHFVHIYHQRKNGMVAMQIDDKLVMEQALYFPNSQQLGTITHAGLLEAMQGLSGPVTVFNTCSPARASAIARRQVSPVHAEGEKLAGGEELAFATYSPESVVGKLCLDLHGSHLGNVLHNTRAWTQNPDRDILRALGGPLILLPFLQVHESKANDDPTLVAEYLLQSILLVASFLEGHAGNLNEFYECQGSKLLHYALESGLFANSHHRHEQQMRMVKREMLREAGRDLLSAISALTRACGVDTVGTSNEGGARLARVLTWRTNSAEFELDSMFTYNLAFWVKFVDDAQQQEEEEDGHRLRMLLSRCVQFGAQRLADRPAAMVRKKMGVRFFLDKIREMLQVAEHMGSVAFANVQKTASRFVDTVIAPLFAEQNSTPVTKDEVRVILDFAIGSGFGVGSDSFRERRRTWAWDEVTTAVSYCALRLLVRMFAHNHNHAVLNSFQLPSILAVEVVAFCGIGERLRALALRVIGLSHATLNKTVDMKIGFSYISTALAFAVSKAGEHPQSRFAARLDQYATSPKAQLQAAGARYSSFSSNRPPTAFATSTTAASPKSPGSSNLVAGAASQSHISHEIYNALLSMTITPTGVAAGKTATVKWKQVCSSALSDGEGEEHLGADQFELPVVVLDDAMKIANLEAIQVILDLLPHMSVLVQQRAFQDLYVLLKFDLSNRKSMGSIPQWQTSLGTFVGAGQTEPHIVQMGMKIWVLILQDCVFRNESDAVLEAYWLRASIGKQVSDMVLNSLFESLLAQTATVPPPLSWEALVKVAELAGLYTHAFQLFDMWNIPAPSPATAAMLIYNSTKLIDSFALDMISAARAARRIQKLVSGPSVVRNNALLVDAAVFAIARVHAAFAKLRRKFEFDSAELSFLDAGAMLLVSCAKYVSQAKSQTLINDLIELANSSSPNRDVFLRSKWSLYDLEPGFASLALVTLEELSFSLNRAERDKFDQRFAKEKERLALLARARQELESSVRESEERQVFLELSRLSSMQISHANESRHIADKWKRLQRQILLGNTIWRDPSVFDHFCVPNREDHLRRRLYLETNTEYESHEDAAYANTLSHSNNILASPAPAPTPASTKSLLANNIAVFDKDEEILYVVESARLVTPSYVIFGRVEVSAKHVLFYAAVSGEDGSKQQPKLTRARWRLDELLEIHSRRYLLRPIAIELFFLDRTTAFFAFSSSAIRDECSTHILKQKPLRLEKAFTGSLAPPAMVLKRSKLTEMWRKREISNFEYLMKLNMIAGRTYNDLTQYFVFPWVIRDYESAELDLTKPNTFRDLAKPVGALNASREAEVRERFEMFSQDDMGIPAFHHGSHYSSAGVVLHYLIRIEPFTTLAIELQSGRFDVPDRLFHSIKDCFKSCYSSVVDCRELIPEFYYSAEVFENRDALQLGVRQDGAKVDNVLLPAWAKGDPELFVRINREALESDYVSDMLHNWIDLIFGYKQRGKEAELACNVFSHLSYEGAVDIDAIEPSKRAAIEMQILEFGQCPSQLLTTPHPKRMSTAEWGKSVVVDLLREASYFRQVEKRRWQLLVWRKQFWTAPPPPPLPAITSDTVVASAMSLAPARSVKNLFSIFARSSNDAVATPSPPPPPPPSQALLPPPLLSITCFPDRAVLVHADFTASVVHLIDGGADASILEMRLATQTISPSCMQSRYVTTRPRDAGLVGTSLGEALRGKSSDFAITQGGNLLVSSAFFDGSLRCIRMDGTKLETNLVGHRAKVTCLAQDGRFLVSGDDAGAITLWKVGGSHDSREEMLEAFGETSAKFGSHESLLRVHRHLFGHNESITSIAISCSLGLVCTGSRNGDLLVHNLEDDSMANIRKLPSRQAFQGESVDLICISSGSGTIVAHSSNSRKLCSFSPNGRLLHSVFLQEKINFLEVAQFHEQDVFISGGDRTGEVFIRRTRDLQVTRTISFLKRYRGVRCCGVFPNGKYILVGCVDGSVIVLGEGTQVEPGFRGTADGGKQGMVLSE